MPSKRGFSVRLRGRSWFLVNNQPLVGSQRLPAFAALIGSAADFQEVGAFPLRQVIENLEWPFRRNYAWRARKLDGLKVDDLRYRQYTNGSTI